MEVKREHLIALCLLAGALFLVLKVETSTPGEVVDESGSKQKEQRGAGESRGAGRGDRPEGRPGRTRSRRVRREALPEIVTASGLVYQVRQEGEGDHPGSDSKVTVHYVGTLDDGTVFDSSRDRGTPSEFSLNQVIKGWTEGLQLMKPGGRFDFTIPPELGYGKTGAGDQIPPDATLHFEIELISVESP